MPIVNRHMLQTQVKTLQSRKLDEVKKTPQERVELLTWINMPHQVMMG